MNENHSWSASIGRWMGVQVCMHVLLFLFVAAIFCVQYEHQHVLSRDMTGTALATTLVILFSVVLHEIAHVYALISLGGIPRRIVLTPWGGNSCFVLPHEPAAKLIVYAAGPFANIAVFLICAVILLQGGQSDILSLMNPFQPHVYMFSESGFSLLKIVAWANFQLLLVNLIPCFPLDGAQIIRSMLGVLQLDDSKLRSESAIMVIGNGCAFAVIGFAWLLYGQEAGPIEPVWFIMLAAGITLYFASRYSMNQETAELIEEQGLQGQDWDFDPYVPQEASFFGLTSESDYQDLARAAIDQSDSVTQSQWMLENQNARAAREREQEMHESSQADAILEKLHNGGGIASLSEGDREVLNRVSRRLRRQRESQNSALQGE